MNAHNVPYGYFSVLNEITFLLIAPMEKYGYTIDGKHVPDISVGKTFSDFLRNNGYDIDSYPKYSHDYEDGRSVMARAYPNEVLHLIRNFYFEV